jgi:hypothetical protein
MKFIVLIYNDPSLMGEVPAAELNSTLRDCIAHADEMNREGRVLQSEILEDTRTARTMRVRHGRKSILDGPFAETKEVLGGFNIVEAPNIDEAMRIAEEFPWAKLGSIEVRPIREMSAIRKSVGLPAKAR